MNPTNPFHISENETRVLLDDFQHQVERKIEHHGDEQGFPQMADYQVTKGATLWLPSSSSYHW